MLFRSITGGKYFVIRNSATSYKLAATQMDAASGNAINLTVSSASSGANGTTNTFTFASDPGLADGAKVTVSRVSGNATLSGIDLGGTSYYAQRDGSSNNFILSATPTGAAIDFSINANYAIQTVDYEADTVTFASAPGINSGDAVVFNRDEGASSITGLTLGGTYYAIKVNDTTYKLAATNGGNAIDLKLSGTLGSAFSLSKPVDSTTSVFKLEVVSTHAIQNASVSAPIAPIGGLSNGMTYYAIKVDNTTISLAASAMA